MTAALQEIQQQLKAHSTPEAAAASRKFVPGEERIYGVRVPVLNELTRQYKAGGFELVEACWEAGSGEEKLIAAKILGLIAKKDPERTLRLVRRFSGQIANWAVCDTLGTQSIKPLVKQYTAEIFALAETLNPSKNFWQRRLSLVLVEWYTRDKSHHPAIRKLIRARADDPEYYVKKAVEWISRNLKKGK